MSAEEVGAIWGTILKYEAWQAKTAWRAAQNAGMRYQNWRHKGAGEADSTTPATTSTGPAKKGSGKNWSTDERFKNTTVMSTTEWSKKTR